MALPKIESPIYEVELPLSKQKLKFRPFVVKEQRNLMMALESDDSEMVKTNIIQVLQNCSLSESNIKNLPMVDIEYYFLNLRARSVGEVVENSYKCNNEHEGKECGYVTDVNVNLLDIHVEGQENLEDTFKITDKVTVKLNYPKFSIIDQMKNSEGVEDFAFRIVADSIEWIHDGEQYYYAKESSPEELLEFVDSLSQAQFDKLQKFFEQSPKLMKNIKFKCGRCGFDHSINVEGLESFFV
jgi:hypothetical protein